LFNYVRLLKTTPNSSNNSLVGTVIKYALLTASTLLFSGMTKRGAVITKWREFDSRCSIYFCIVSGVTNQQSPTFPQSFLLPFSASTCAGSQLAVQ